MPELRWRTSNNRVLIDLLILRGGDPNDLTSIPARALVDTGATVSGIGPRLIEGLDLRSYAKKLLKSATEERYVDYYLFRIGFELNPDETRGSSGNQLPFVFDDTDGFSWGRAADFDVILGMDVIRRCDLLLRRDGTGSLAFG